MARLLRVFWCASFGENAATCPRTIWAKAVYLKLIGRKLFKTNSLSTPVVDRVFVLTAMLWPLTVAVCLGSRAAFAKRVKWEVGEFVLLVARSSKTHNSDAAPATVGGFLTASPEPS